MEKKKVTKKTAKSRNEDRKFEAFIAAFLTVIGFIIAILLWKKDKYVMFYAKEGLILFIGFIIAAVVGWIPILGQLYLLFVFILWIITWVYALSGKIKKTWIVGDLAEKIDI